MTGTKTQEGRNRRVRIFQAIRDSYEADGYPPRTTELAEQTGYAHTTMLWHMRSLRDQGFLLFTDGDVTRTLRPVKDKDSSDII
jgi:hypothetical protein